MSSTFCVCTRCGFNEPATDGIPCSMKACFECNGPMVEKSQEELNSLPQQELDISAVHSDQAQIDYSICTNCGACVMGCVYGSITIIDEKPAVDPNGCSGCLACAISCPVGAIS